MRAIALWLAMTNPDKKLVPTDPEGLARTIEALDFIVGTVHMLSWRLWRRPDAYSDNPDEHAAIAGARRSRNARSLCRG